MKTEIANAEVYLNLLASRAVTGLVQLARDPSAWNAAIEADLEKGVTFCDALSHDVSTEAIEFEANEKFARVLKRLKSEVPKGRPGLYVSAEEIKHNADYLRGLVRRDIIPDRPQITGSMRFFLKATSGQSTRQKSDNELF